MKRGFHKPRRSHDPENRQRLLELGLRLVTALAEAIARQFGLCP
jgi:hypothetical protein